VNHKQITLAKAFKGGLQLGPLRVFARSLVGKHLVDLQALKLTFSLLIKGADFAISGKKPSGKPWPPWIT
jgi:hypothetical protein